MTSRSQEFCASYERLSSNQDHDRRGDLRVNLEMECAFQIGEGYVHQAVTKNIAASGVAIATPSISKMAPKRGQTIHIQFKEFGEYTGEISRVFDGGFAITLPQSSLAVLALSQI